MSEFSNDVRERKLFKLMKDGKSHRRVMTIEEVSGVGAFKYRVKIADTESSHKGFGKFIPTHRFVVPRATIEEAVEDAEKEFASSVIEGKFERVPIGKDFPPSVAPGTGLDIS